MATITAVPPRAMATIAAVPPRAMATITTMPPHAMATITAVPWPWLCHFCATLCHGHRHCHATLCHGHHRCCAMAMAVPPRAMATIVAVPPALPFHGRATAAPWSPSPLRRGRVCAVAAIVPPPWPCIPPSPGLQPSPSSPSRSSAPCPGHLPGSHRPRRHRPFPPGSPGCVWFGRGEARAGVNPALETRAGGGRGSGQSKHRGWVSHRRGPPPARPPHARRDGGTLPAPGKRLRVPTRVSRRGAEPAAGVRHTSHLRGMSHTRAWRGADSV